MEELDAADMQLIAGAAFRRLPPALLAKMIGFARALQYDVVVRRRLLRIRPPAPRLALTSRRLHRSRAASPDRRWRPPPR